MKKLLIFFLALFAIVSIKPLTEVKADDTYRIWFYNAANWSSVSAYMWGAQGTLLGSWPGEAAIQEDTSRWWYMDFTNEAPFNLIFNNGGGAQAGGIYITDKVEAFSSIFADTLYASKAETETEMADFVIEIDPDALTTVWFYNTSGWARVYVYVYGTLQEYVTGEWPGTRAQRDGDTYWYSFDVPADVPFNIIFNDGTDANKAESYVANDTNVYMTVVNDNTFPDRSSAEAIISFITPIPETNDDPIDVVPIDIEPGMTIDVSGTLLDKMLSIVFISSYLVFGIAGVGLTVAFYLLKRKQ